MEQETQNIVENQTQPEMPKSQTMQMAPIAGAILLAGVFIAGAILLRGSTPPVVKNTQFDPIVAGTEDSKAPRAITSEDYIFGNPNAEIFIIEYSDTECPFCKRFHLTMHEVIRENNGNVAWVYRHFPITDRHPRAAFQAEAMECAGEIAQNEGFWRFADELYNTTNSNNTLKDEELLNIAIRTNIEPTAFKSCLESGKYRDKVMRDLLDGDQAGVNGTPHSFIVKDGKVVDIIPGAQPIEVIREQLKRSLK